MVKRRKFNTTGICIPELHYMVDMSDRIEMIINEYIAYGEYFTINRARQYGKSTILELLYHRMNADYLVLDISFEAADDCFVSMHALAQGFVNKISRVLAGEMRRKSCWKSGKNRLRRNCLWMRWVKRSPCFAGQVKRSHPYGG